MKKSNFRKQITVITVVMVLGLVSLPFNSTVSGEDKETIYSGGKGQDKDNGGYGCPGKGYMGNLKQEDITKLDTERKNFLATTEDLRQKIYEKELELKVEFAKKDTDPKKALALQKEISDLEAQFDYKKVEHQIAVKKINPNFGRGMGMHMMSGMGKGQQCGRKMGSCDNYCGAGRGKNL